MAYTNRIMAKTQKLADIIRVKREISFGDLCVEGHIAPSTLYNYAKIILKRFLDIEYEGGWFRSKQLK